MKFGYIIICWKNYYASVCCYSLAQEVISLLYGCWGSGLINLSTEPLSNFIKLIGLNQKEAINTIARVMVEFTPKELRDILASREQVKKLNIGSRISVVTESSFKFFTVTGEKASTEGWEDAIVSVEVYPDEYYVRIENHFDASENPDVVESQPFYFFDAQNI